MSIDGRAHEAGQQCVVRRAGVRIAAAQQAHHAAGWNAHVHFGNRVGAKVNRLHRCVEPEHVECFVIEPEHILASRHVAERIAPLEIGARPAWRPAGIATGKLHLGADQRCMRDGVEEHAAYDVRVRSLRAKRSGQAEGQCNHRAGARGIARK